MQILPDIAPGFTATEGRTPVTDQRLTIQFRCGYVDLKHSYLVGDIRWNNTGHPWDVLAIKLADQ
jgi:hypothetical protein|tara:strand:- start:481 stop:675 length:195 start_codon:yes stop_codon:yes gene_type:complete